MNDEIGILMQQLANAGAGPVPPPAQDRFHQIAQGSPPEALSRGLTAAFNSDQTPDFGHMVARMFGQADPEQKTGIVNRLLAGIGPAATAVLARLGFPQLTNQSAAVPPIVTPGQAAELSPAQVQEIASHAQSSNPGIVETMSNFYAQHPVLVKSLGAAALAIILANVQHTR